MIKKIPRFFSPVYYNSSLCSVHSRVHISESTYNCVKLDYEVEPGEGHSRNDFIKEQGIKTYLVVKKKNDGSNNNTKLSSMSEVSVVLP